MFQQVICMHTRCPVSYTHLDVYKRQMWYSVGTMYSSCASGYANRIPPPNSWRISLERCRISLSPHLGTQRRWWSPYRNSRAFNNSLVSLIRWLRRARTKHYKTHMTFGCHYVRSFTLSEFISKRILCVAHGVKNVCFEAVRWHSL